jgi:hypothetical protein
MSENQQVTLHFVHPTDSTRVLTATVGSASTPHYLLDQLVKNDFMPPSPNNQAYKLVDPNQQRELVDHQTLAQAGVMPDTTLNVMPAYTGASRRGDRR